MSERTDPRRRIAALLLALAFAAAASAVPAAPIPAVAILEIANAGMDPRVDYLSGIIQGILAFDLGSRSDLALVDRRNLDAVMKEKELSLSALGQDADSVAAAGRLAGADWILTGEYVFLGAEVLVTLSLTDAATAKRTVFRDRGGSENLVHKLAEQVALRLTGKEAAFADPGRSRSLVSLRDETPGSLALFSPIIKAEIFIDEKFVGYTGGDGTAAIVFDALSPGKHRVRVHLDKSFGVVKLPEVSFGDWETYVEIEPNKRSTIKDETRQLNSILYRLIELGTGSARAPDAETKPGSPAPKLAFAKELAFQDRTGAKVAVRLQAKPRLEGETLVLDFALSAGDRPDLASMSISLPAGEEGEKEAEVEAGIVKLSATLERYTDYWTLDWRLERTDIRQGMFDE